MTAIDDPAVPAARRPRREAQEDDQRAEALAFLRRGRALLEP